MTDAEVNALLDQHPRIEDEFTREVARGVMRRLETRGRHDDAYWARIEAHAARFVAGALMSYSPTEVDVVKLIDGVLALAVVLVDTVDRRRREQT